MALVGTKREHDGQNYPSMKLGNKKGALPWAPFIYSNRKLSKLKKISKGLNVCDSSYVFPATTTVCAVLRNPTTSSAIKCVISFTPNKNALNNTCLRVKYGRARVTTKCI